MPNNGLLDRIAVLEERLVSVLGQRSRSNRSYSMNDGIKCVVSDPASGQEQGTACNIHQPSFRESLRLPFRRAIGAVTPVAVPMMLVLGGWIC